MDAGLEEELYDLLTLCIQQPESPDLAARKIRVMEIGRELAADGGTDAMENMFCAPRGMLGRVGGRLMARREAIDGRTDHVQGARHREREVGRRPPQGVQEGN